jgi:hypothetical protein
MVSPTSAPLNAKSAYVLFYCREKTDLLNEALNHRAAVPTHSNVQVNSNGNGNKRGRDNDNGVSGSPASKKNYIGPQLPAYPSPRPPTVLSTASPQYSPPQPKPNAYQQSLGNKNSNSRVQSSPYGPGSNSFSNNNSGSYLGSPQVGGRAGGAAGALRGNGNGNGRGGFNKSGRGGKVPINLVGKMAVSMRPRVIKD